MASLVQYLDPEVIQQVSRLDLRARFIVEGFLAGLHASPFHGFSVEFSEHRKYVQGDDLRSIDWKVFARTDRLYVRKYNAETHLECFLLVDASASMGFVGPADLRGASSSRPAAKLLYVTHLAAALGYLLIRQQDAVGLAVISSGLQQFLPARSRRQDLLQLLAVLSTIAPSGQTGLREGIEQALAQIRHRGLIVLLSDLLTDQDKLLEALHHVRFRGHDLIVMHVLDAAEAAFPFDGPVRLEDPETAQYAVLEAAAVRSSYLRALQEWREQLRQRLAAIRADYLPLDTSMPFDRALVEFLNERCRRS
jgi:uncharacterized protein (DUF58 family)